MKTTRSARCSCYRLSMILAIAAAALAAGCATTPVPADKVARSQAAIRSAEELGASNDPRAAMHLKFAKQQLAQAKALMKNGDNKSAGLVLLRAEADGEAALNLARARAAEVDAKRTVEAVQHAIAEMHGGQGS